VATLLDVCLIKCFESLSSERRDSVLFELLLALPSFINLSGISPAAEISLSETTIILTTKLREDRTRRMSVQEDPTPMLPLDKMLAIFKSILGCILDPGVSEFVRGNLYAGLINYLQLIETLKLRSIA
jgi:nuclear pore complex protein Nup205